MPQYRVLQKSFIGHRIVEEGEIVDYEGDVSDNLELIKKGKSSAKTVGTDSASVHANEDSAPVDQLV